MRWVESCGGESEEALALEPSVIIDSRTGILMILSSDRWLVRIPGSQDANGGDFINSKSRFENIQLHLNTEKNMQRLSE